MYSILFVEWKMERASQQWKCIKLVINTYASWIEDRSSPAGSHRGAWARLEGGRRRPQTQEDGDGTPSLLFRTWRPRGWEGVESVWGLQCGEDRRNSYWEASSSLAAPGPAMASLLGIWGSPLPLQSTLCPSACRSLQKGEWAIGAQTDRQTRKESRDRAGDRSGVRHRGWASSCLSLPRH